MSKFGLTNPNLRISAGSCQELGGLKSLATALLLTTLLVGACDAVALPSAGTPVDRANESKTAESTVQIGNSGPEAREASTEGKGSEATASTAENRPTEAAAAHAGEESAEQFPIEVTYFTPSQTEGPFYPLTKPTDRDNDLYILKGAEARPVGTILEFDGTLYDGAGMPVPEAIIEIWQTDNNGAYLHPSDSAYSRRDVNFQSYGESLTDEFGRYSFRTILPAEYNPRPRHIHVKVKIDGQTLLTTQFYFSNDDQAAGDRFFAGAGEEDEALIMELREGFDFEGNQGFIGSRDIVLRSTHSE